MIKIPVKGMRDILPSDMMVRGYILRVVEEIVTGAGYQKIETPAVEHLENLSSKIGGENEALIFKILKRGQALERATSENTDLTDSALRYDLTVPLARYFSANSNELTMPFKSLQIGPVWRADAPQKGRFRQFMQCDLDILGDNSILVEIDIINTVVKILAKICQEANLSGLTLRLNDRRILLSAIQYAGFNETDAESILIALDKMDKIGLDGVKAELLDRGFNANNVDNFIQLFTKNNLSPSEFCQLLTGIDINEEIIQNLEIIKSAIQNDAIKVIFDPTLVRGMGYYTGPIFECSIDGLNSSVAGGGRYDQMIGKFSGGNDVPACGFSIGFERLVTILTDSGFKPKERVKMTAILVGNKVSSKQYGEIIKRAEQLRQSGQIVSILPMMRNLGRQITILEQNGYTDFEKIYGD